MSDYTPAQSKAIELFTKALERSDKANAAVAAVQTEANDAAAELGWYAAHPALNGIDLNKLAEEIRAGGSTEKPADAPAAEEKPKAKRTRRTKAQIAEDEAREAAEKAAAAAAPAADEGAGVSTPAAPEADDDTFSEAEQEQPAAALATPAAPVTNPFASGGAPAAPASAGFTNPFAQG